jgi:hypothetical protein
MVVDQFPITTLTKHKPAKFGVIELELGGPPLQQANPLR